MVGIWELDIWMEMKVLLYELAEGVESQKTR